ncbi:MAG: hypothetical protein ACYCVB_01600 [Bacilli bacterium]
MSRTEPSSDWAIIEHLYEMIMASLAEERYHDVYVLMSDRTRRICLLDAESRTPRETLLQMAASTAKLEAAIQQAMRGVQQKLHHEVNSIDARRAYAVSSALGQYRNPGHA